MKKVPNLFILIFLFVSITKAQEVKIPSATIDKYIIGFDCYYSVKTTDLVNKFKKLIQDKKYDTIATFLNSNKSAEQYLSLKIIKKADEIGKYKISNNDSILIRDIYKSEKLVSVCSGCTYFDEITLISLINQNDLTKFDIGTNYWLDEIFKLLYEN